MSLKAILTFIWPREHEVYAQLDEAGKDLLAGCEEILLAVQSGKEGDFVSLREHMVQRKDRAIQRAEQIADALNHRFMPAIEGEAALQIARVLQGIEDCLDRTAECLSVYGVPSEAHLVQELAEVSVTAMKEISDQVRDLPGEGSPPYWEERLERLYHLRARAKEGVRDALGRLYTVSGDAVVLIKTKDILDRLENTLDCIHEAGKTLHTLMLFD